MDGFKKSYALSEMLGVSRLTSCMGRKSASAVLWQRLSLSFLLHILPVILGGRVKTDPVRRCGADAPQRDGQASKLIERLAMHRRNFENSGFIHWRRNLRYSIRLRGGVRPETSCLSNTERWEACGYNLQPDFGPEAHPDVPLDTKLGDAAEFNDANAVRRLIQAGANVNAVDWAGFTPLHRAAWNGCLEASEVLLQAGANPNIQDHVGGRTPLHQAASQGHKRVVERLVACGADPHIRDFPYKPDVNQIPGYWEAIRELGSPLAPECGQCADGTLEYVGMTPKQYAEDEDQHSTAELLRPWTDEY